METLSGLISRDSPRLSIKRNALWVLANMIGDGTSATLAIQIIDRSNFINHLDANAHPTLIPTIAFSVSNISKYVEILTQEQFQSLAHLCKHFCNHHSKSLEIIKDILFAVGYLAEGDKSSEKAIAILAEGGIVEEVVRYLSDEDKGLGV